MNGEASDAVNSHAQTRLLRNLVAWGVLIWLIQLAVTWLSWRFQYVDSHKDIALGYKLLRQRPIVPVLLLWAASFGCYLAALRTAIRCRNQRRLSEVIVLFAFCFRAVLLFSEPIQEVDIYRYVWDGAATATGVSPFYYSPEQVIRSCRADELPDDLRRLVELRDSSPALATILSRVHFAHLPTVYPPVSQAVFAAACMTTPRAASVRTRLAVMRIWLLLFDLGTIGVLWLLVRHVGKPDGWVLAYAWCPLVLKEFANSGHLDSIAVCLTMLALYLCLRVFCPAQAGDHSVAAPSLRRNGLPTIVAAAALLALAVGAKLYPLVLVPLLAATSLRRLGLIRTLLPAAVFVAVAAAVCAPLLFGRITSPPLPATNVRDTVFSESAPQPIPPDVETPQDPRRGLKTFLNRWEMNDFLFLILVENLDPAAGKPPQQQAWFVITSRGWRSQLVSRTSELFSLDPKRVPFLLTRFLCSVVFLALAVRWSIRYSGTGPSDDFLRGAFLTLAWFWLLLPTQNPWYWIWALPLVPFARSRAWLIVSGLTLLYYSRFWFGYHWPASPVLGTPYRGTLFFDFVMTWLEFGPWFIWLSLDSLRFRKRQCPH